MIAIIAFFEERLSFAELDRRHRSAEGISSGIIKALEDRSFTNDGFIDRFISRWHRRTLLFTHGLAKLDYLFHHGDNAD
jgi:hypothetical protein